MISNPGVAATTAIHIFYVLSILAICLTICRQRPISLTDPASRPAGLFVTGLIILALYGISDLAALHVLPLLIGQERAFALSSGLHRYAEWFIVAVSMPLVCVGFILDNRARTRMERKLEESEARFRSIVHDQPDMIVRWKDDGIRTWVNEPYLKAFGMTRDEAIGSSFFNHVEDIDTVTRKRDSLTPSSPTYTNFHEVRMRDGATAWQEWVSRGLFDANGNLIEVQSIGRDVTDRMQTARALQDSEARFRGFVENTPDFVWETDLDARFTYCNGQSQTLLGFRPGELLNRTVTEFMHPEIVEEFKSKQPEAIRQKKGWRNKLVQFRHRNGAVRYVESSADPVFDDEGRLIGHRGIDRDRTFQTLLTQLSLDLVGCKADEVNDRIDQSLEKIGRSYDLDRLSIWWVRGEFMYRDNDWARDGLSGSRVQFAKLSDLPNAQQKLLTAGEIYKVASVADMPMDSADRNYIEAQDIRSLMIVPLQHEGKTIGIAACATVGRERRWQDDAETELRLLLGKITDAKQQAESTLAIFRRERDLSLSEELAQVGSYAFYPTDDSADFPRGWAAQFSAELCELIEAREDEASYELLLSRIHEDDKSRIDSAMAALVNDGSRFEQEFRFSNPGGQIVHIASRAELEIGRAGEISRIVGSCRDITEQFNREEALVIALEDNEALRDRLHDENILLREEIQTFTEFEQIIGESTALRASLNLAARAAPTDSTILILGETGTGKELVAKAIHKLSNRADQRLVSVNCTALPANLIESELFGHEKGAFTGASGRRAGRFEIADGGTLFLDEIGDLPLELQSKLLRVLEDGGFERLGGTRTIRPDVRLIAATNRNLEAMVRAGKFRADLYYRINTVPIELPPLRDRKEDIPMLAQHFVDKHRERLGKSVIAIASRMIEFLLNREWPGNVRELENYIERALISATGKVLSIGEQSSADDRTLIDDSTVRPTELKLVEREHILHVLNNTGWVIDGTKGAAAVLGLAPSTLRSRMKRLGIARRA